MLRSILFTMLMFLSVCVYCVPVIISRPFGHRLSYRFGAAWGRTVLWLLRSICGLDVSLEGREHLPGTNPIVFLKHSSALETIAQLVLFPPQCWVLKRELLWAPFFGWGLACLHPIAIDRQAGRGAVDQVLAQGRERLEEGLWIMLFPEGTRMPPGETRRYGISGTLLAQENARPIVPVAHNAGDFWPRRGWHKRPGTVRFVIGPPVDPRGRDAREVNRQIQDWIEAEVARLRSECAPPEPSPG